MENLQVEIIYQIFNDNEIYSNKYFWRVYFNKFEKGWWALFIK